MVSPIALMMPSTIAAMMPDEPTGRTTFFIVSHFVAPREMDASLYSLGTDLIASTESEVIVGSIMIERIVDASSRPRPVDGCRLRKIGMNPRTALMDGLMLYRNILSRTNSPNMPYTTDGMPTSSSIIGLSIFATTSRGIFC